MKLIIKNPTKANLASLVTKGIYLFMYFQNIYYSVQSASNTNKIVNMIHEKLNKMTMYIQYSKEIGKIFKKSGIKTLAVSFFRKGVSILHRKIDNFKELLDWLTEALTNQVRPSWCHV